MKQQLLDEFINPTIIRGFPTIIQPQGCAGVEISSSLLFSPFKDTSIEFFGKRVFLNSLGKKLELYKRTKDVCVWHRLDSPSHVCYCRYKLTNEEEGEVLDTLSSATIRESRHILGECVISNGGDGPNFERYDNKMDASTPIVSDENPTQLKSPSIGSLKTTTSVSDTLDSLDPDMLSISSESDREAGGSMSHDGALFPIINKISSYLLVEYGAYIQSTSTASAIKPYCARTGYSGENNSGKGGNEQNKSTGNQNNSQGPLGINETPVRPVISVRKRPIDPDDNESDDEEAKHNPKRTKPSRDKCGLRKRPFACPFWKHDPRKHRNCFRKKLDEICRVKQHLVRDHMPKFYCDRCLLIFPTKERKRTHLRDEKESCIFVDSARLDGITSEQRGELSQKSKFTFLIPKNGLLFVIFCLLTSRSLRHLIWTRTFPRTYVIFANFPRIKGRRLWLRNYAETTLSRRKMN
jgi:hypothetical protein